MSVGTKYHRWCAVAGITILMILMTCSPTNLGADGGPTTQTGNGMVIGTVYRSDGTTPADGAYVSLRKKTKNVSISGLLENKSAITETHVRADSRGGFVIDSVDTGFYVIIATDSSNNYAFNDSILLQYYDSTVELSPVVLVPAGAVKGTISLSEGGDPRKIFIVIEEVNRFAHADTDGRFKIDMLPTGTYSLTILPTLDNYGVIDTLTVQVKPADTTDAGSIEPPFLGIPKIADVTANYDTLRQWVTLRWRTGSPSLVASYNVYRQTIDPATKTLSFPIVFTGILDTVFIDSLCDQEKQYEYRVSALDTLSLEGEKSIPVKVTIALYPITPVSTILHYDTLLQTVTLRWGNPDTTRVKQFNVYRRNVDLNEQFWTPFTIRPIQDTFFIDSVFNICPNYTFTPSGVTDCSEPTYEYCVAALLDGIREGVRSEGIPIHVSVKYIKPENVRGEYDPSRECVVLHWSIPDRSLVAGFSILRRNTDMTNDAFVHTNDRMIEDTVYSDFNVRADATYEYRIASIINGRAEVKSEGVPVKTASTD